MAVEIPKTAYSGRIKETTLGIGDKAVKVGGETCYPFYLFDFAAICCLRNFNCHFYLP